MPDDTPPPSPPPYTLLSPGPKPIAIPDDRLLPFLTALRMRQRFNGDGRLLYPWPDCPACDKAVRDAHFHARDLLRRASSTIDIVLQPCAHWFTTTEAAVDHLTPYAMDIATKLDDRTADDAAPRASRRTETGPTIATAQISVQVREDTAGDNPAAAGSPVDDLEPPAWAQQVELFARQAAELRSLREALRTANSLRQHSEACDESRYEREDLTRQLEEERAQRRELGRRYDEVWQEFRAHSARDRARRRTDERDAWQGIAEARHSVPSPAPEDPASTLDATVRAAWFLPNPSGADLTARRQPAYDAVWTYLRALSPEELRRGTNSSVVLWRAVEHALEAAGVGHEPARAAMEAPTTRIITTMPPGYRPPPSPWGPAGPMTGPVRWVSGIPTAAEGDCPAGLITLHGHKAIRPCIVKGPHVGHRAADGTRWTSPDDIDDVTDAPFLNNRPTAPRADDRPDGGTEDGTTGSSE